MLKTGALQARLEIGQRGDPHEQEADRVAERVMRMPAPAIRHLPVWRADVPSRKKEEESLQKKEIVGHPIEVASGAKTIIRSSRGGGHPLSESVRAFYEPRFGIDFSQVRVHTDAKASEAAKSVNAQAFTVGRDVMFGAGRYSPGTEAGNRLLAHELTHTIQQGGGTQFKRFEHTDHPPDQDAATRAGIARIGQMSIARRGDLLTVQREEKDKAPWWKLAEFGETVAWKMLEEFAPELVPIVRKGPEGVLDWLKDRVTSAMESVFDTLMAPVRSITGIGRRLTGQFAPLLAWLQDATVKISKNDCQPLREAAEKIEQAATGLIQPIVEHLQPVIAKIQSFFSGLWEKFGAPIWGWIKSVAAQQWAMIEGLATWVWDKTAPIRNNLGKAWVWLKNKLGIGEGPEGQNGILQWVQAKLGAAWEWLKVKLEPYKKEIAVIAGVVGSLALLLSPAGPVVVIGGLVVGVVQAVRWIKSNWGKGVLQARTFVEKTLIPGLLGAAGALTSKVTAVTASINGTLGNLAAGLGRMVGAAAGSVLRFAVAAAQWLAEQVNELAEWAGERLADFAIWLKSALDRLQVFAHHVMDFLAAVGHVITDVYAIQGKILKKFWDLIPACIRDPVVDFLIPLIIRQIELFQELVSDNEAWQKTKKDVMNILHLLFEDHDLNGALKAVFDLILRVFNIPPELLVTIKQKAISAWDIVVKKPLAFIKNLIRSIGHGFSLLWKNLKGHVIYGLERWLIGPLADKGIQPPSSWTDPKAVFGFVVGVMGLSVDHIFELLKKRFDPAKIDKIRNVFGKIKDAWDWITNAIDTSKSPAENTKGLIDKAKGFATTVFTGIAEWIVEKVGAELAEYAAAAAASAGVSAVLDVFKRIYRALVTAKRWMRQILDMVNQALDDISAVANGAIETVGEKFEKLMHRGMPMVISFLGDQVGLGGIPSKIREVVEGLRAKVDDAILWLIDKIKAGIEALIAGLKSAGKAILEWWKKKSPFKAKDGTDHAVYVDGKDDSAVVYVQSDRIALDDLLPTVPAKDKGTVTSAKGAITKAINEGKKNKTEAEVNASSAQIQTQLDILAKILPNSGAFLMLPAPTYEFKVDSQHRAEKATVKNLSSQRPWGSEPGSANPPGWEYAQAVRLTEKIPPGLRRLHFINERFGGPGESMNLAVASKKDNEKHLTQVENKIKKIVGDEPRLRPKLCKTGGDSEGVVSEYVVSAKYFASGKLLKKGKATSRLSDFATGFTCTWKYIKLTDLSAGAAPTEETADIQFDDSGTWGKQLEDSNQ